MNRSDRLDDACGRGEALVAYARAELAPAEARSIRAHVFACPACRDELAMITSVFDLASCIPEVSVSADFDCRLEQRLLERSRAVRGVSRATRGPAPDSGRIAGLVLFVRHRVRTAPLLAASFLIHLGVATFLSVFVYERMSGRHAGAHEIAGEIAGEIVGLGTGGGIPDTDEGADPMLRRLPAGLDGDARSRGERLAALDRLLPEPPDPPAAEPVYSGLDRRELSRYEGGLPGVPREAPPWQAARRRGAEELARLGEAGSASAIARGHAWLAAAQMVDGGWPAGGGTAFDASDYRVGVTGLALLSFLAEGETARYGTHMVAVARGMAFLRGAQHDDGLIGPRRGNYLYNHVIAVQAMAEHLLLGGCAPGQVAAERDRLVRGVRLLARAQQDSGGWGYGTDPGCVADSSVTGWVAALARVLRVADCPLPAHTREAMRAYWASVTDAEGQVGYRRMGEATDGRFTLSCAGLLAQRVLDAERGAASGLAPRKATSAAQRAAVLRTALASLDTPAVAPGGGAVASIDHALAYQTTLALDGLPEEAMWHPAIRARLLSLQVEAGPEAGSWSPDDRYGALGGRTYATAASALSLQAHYRYR